MRSRRLAALVHGCFAVGHRAVGRHWLLGRLPADDRGMKSRVHPKYKTRYHVANWPEYDRALVQRGDVTLWLSADAIDAFLAPAALVHAGEAQADIRLVLFTDVEASTALTDRFGDARARDLLREHERLTREALAQHGGTEIKTMGDGFMASFTSCLLYTSPSPRDS